MPQRFIGFDEQSMTYNRQYRISGDPPECTIVQDAIVCAMRPTTPGNRLEDLAGGVFGADGALVVAAAQPRSDGRNGVRLDQGRPASLQPTDHLKRAVFGGVAYDHFGHFLLESTARLWCLPDYRDLPWIFATDGQAALRGYQQGFLSVLGLSQDQILTVADCVAVDQLIVPHPSFIYHHHVTQAYRETFSRAVLPKDPPGGRRIFLSRSNTTIARTVGEQELEEILRRDGWEIVFPETLPPEQQALLFRADNVILGLQGSAMHLGLFAPSGRRVVHLCRGLGYRGYYILDELMEADATYFQAMSSPRLKSKPITGPFRLDLDRTVAFLRDEGLLRGHGLRGGPALSDDRHAELDQDYEAWWHFTESQIRLHRRIADDGTAVDSDAALEPALQAAALRPGEPEILFNAAALTMKVSGPAAAQAFLEDTRLVLPEQRFPPDGQLAYLRSLILAALGDTAASLEVAEEALRLDPGNPLYADQKATVLLAVGRTDDAKAVLDAVIASGRAIGLNVLRLSVVMEIRGEFDEAVRLAREAVRLERDDEGIARHCAGLLRRLHRDDEAHEVLSAFLERGGGSSELLSEMASIAHARGDSANELALLRRAHALSPEAAELCRTFAAVAQANGELPDLSAFDQMPSAAVQEQSVMIYRRSLDLAGMGRLSDAFPVATIAAELFPQNGYIMQNLLGLMLHTGRAIEARLLIHRLIERGAATAESYYVLSLAESELGRQPLARDAARRAAELAPDNAMIREHHGRLQAA